MVVIFFGLGSQAVADLRLVDGLQRGIAVETASKGNDGIVQVEATQYLDYPVNDDQFWRLFGVVLVDAYTGEIQGHLLGQDETNYVVDFYRRMYPQWDAPVPDWLVSQLRYPEFHVAVAANQSRLISTSCVWSIFRRSGNWFAEIERSPILSKRVSL